jgi:hypothetical protein
MSVGGELIEQHAPEAPAPLVSEARLGASPVAALQAMRSGTLARIGVADRARMLGSLQRAAGNAALAMLAREVQGDVTATSVTPAFAQALTDAELESQINLLRGRLANQSDPALQANLAVLEDEAFRRTNAARPAPAATPMVALGIVGMPLAAGMVAAPSPGLPPGMTPGMPPPSYAPPSLPGPQPGNWQFRPPPAPSPGPGPGPVAGVGAGAAIGVSIGALIAAVGAGLAVFFYASPTAQPWEDTINPLTGGPYANREEWDRVRHMSSDEFQEAMGRRGGRRYGSMAQPGSGSGTDGSDRPPPADCHKAIKLLERYERLMSERGSQLPADRLAALDAARDAGTITSAQLPGTLQREWPGGVFDGKTLDQIRRMCGMSRPN